MHASSRSLCRGALAALALLTFAATGATACDARFRAAFNCNHDDVWTFLSIPGVPEPIPINLDLAVAGAGYASHMQGLTVCVTTDYYFELAPPPTPATGAGEVKLRDQTGDLLVLSMDDLTMQVTGAPHFAVFGGKYTVLGAKCTGRFAGATGAGTIKGWADSDLGGLPTPNDQGIGASSGQGYCEFNGTLILPKKAKK